MLAKKEEPKKEEKKIDLKAERERIEKDNKRKQEEYDEKVAAGKKHVKELNDRFADWYYVISDDVYRKIHLTRADFVKKKEAKDKAKDADGHDHADHDHEHDGPDSLPASPAATLEQLKKDRRPETRRGTREESPEKKGAARIATCKDALSLRSVNVTICSTATAGRFPGPCCGERSGRPCCPGN